MNKIKKLILLHYKNYPALQVEDLIKLLYQNEFGPGHLISDIDKYVQSLEEEKLIVHENRYIEDIGNNILRVDVSCIDNPLLFSRYAKLSTLEVKGSSDNFLNKIDYLKRIILDDRLPISLKNFDQIVREYASNGYGPLSHSQFYKKIYNPHYRIISKKCWYKYLKLLKKKRI